MPACFGHSIQLPVAGQSLAVGTIDRAAYAPRAVVETAQLVEL
jgi:hypothetical protein